MRLSVNQLTTYRWSFEEDLFAYREAGFTGAGLWLRKVQDYGEERAGELIAEVGLEPTSLSWAGGFTGGDHASSAENTAATVAAIDLAAALGAGCLLVHPGGRNGHTRRHAERLLRAALDRLLPHAERMAVPLALKPMHPACAGEWTILTDLDDTLRLLTEYDSPALRIVLDSYHFPIGPADAALARELMPRLALVQLGDYVEPRGVDQARVPLGEGEAPLRGFLSVLADAGYDGPVEVKLLGPAVEAIDYDALLSASRAFLAGVPLPPPSDAAAPRPAECNATW